MKYGIFFALCTLYCSCDHERLTTNEPISSDNFDTLYEVQHYYEELFSRVNLNIEDENDCAESYTALVKSAFGPIKIIQFCQTKEKSYHALYETTLANTGERCNYIREISPDEWNEVVEIIEEFDFWTEPIYREPRHIVLDGYLLFVKGVKGGRRNNKIIIRSNPIHDKVGSIGTYLNEHEDWLFQMDTLNNRNKGKIEFW